MLLAGLGAVAPLRALQRPDVTFQVFQFPADKIPRIDGDTSDWDIVPDSYAIKSDQFVDDNKKHPTPDPKNIDVKIRVGWVKGLNRLYFLYEAYDDYWDFALPGLHNDTFEVIVDGDASGGPLIDKGHREMWTPEMVGQTTATPDDRISVSEAHWAIHGVHAQNYHIFTPAQGKDWALAWDSASWVKEFPYANSKLRYDCKPGQPGKIVLEFWITPFDYAGPEGPQRAVESVLRENKIIGLSFVIIDYDDEKARDNNGFWTLARVRTAYGQASELCAFKLMPLEPAFVPALEARWSFKVVDMDRHLVAFKDESIGKTKVTAWKWDFGDGESSTEQFPLHAYKRPGNYVTVLEITGADGTTSRRSKVWDVQLR
ncbi:MAG TPA: PKD domain-containing protein [Opitutaceae bacterium]|nr:PKD domain-containing protein [Opitutaceae bacterium]